MNRITKVVRETYANCTEFVEPTARDCCDFIGEELAEVRRAGSQSGLIPMEGTYLRAHPQSVDMAGHKLIEEYGQLLFMVVELGNLLDIDLNLAIDTASLGMLIRDDKAADREAE